MVCISVLARCLPLFPFAAYETQSGSKDRGDPAVSTVYYLCNIFFTCFSRLPIYS